MYQPTKNTIVSCLSITIIFVFRSINDTVTIYPADVVLVEGILTFYFPEIRNLFHMKLFVDTDSDTRLARRGMCVVRF